MEYSVYHYIFFFFVYSFLGWMIEEIYASLHYQKFVNRGFVNGPLCIKYGICMNLIIFDVKDLAAWPVYQFFMILVLVMAIEYFAGVFLKKITGRKFWDYSDKKWNLSGYICVQWSMIWAVLAVLSVWLIQPFIYMLFELFPIQAIKVILLIITIIFIIDLFTAIAAGLHWKIYGSFYNNVQVGLKKTKTDLGVRLVSLIHKRMYRAFPEIAKQEIFENQFAISKEYVFAKELCLDKLIWIFFICAFLGDVIETFYVWWTAGVVMSRSSLIYGPFSVVWGLGAAVITALLYPLRKKNDSFIFIGGFVLGGVYEYTCSVFTEVVFGTTFWDYSHLPFNINGRVNLLFCFFWGVVAVVWIKFIYPFISRLIEKIPPVVGKIATTFIVVFMILDILISAVAMDRYVNRQQGVASSNAIDTFLDHMYGNELIEKVYPNMNLK